MTQVTPYCPTPEPSRGAVSSGYVQLPCLVLTTLSSSASALALSRVCAPLLGCLYTSFLPSALLALCSWPCFPCWLVRLIKARISVKMNICLSLSNSVCADLSYSPCSLKLRWVS